MEATSRHEPDTQRQAIRGPEFPERDQRLSRRVCRFMRRGLSSILVAQSSSKLGAHELDAVLPPEKLAVDDEGRHGEDALLLGFLLMALQLGRPLARGEGIEA